MNTPFKKNIICFFLLITIQSKGQDKFAAYDNTFISKSYEIKISAKEKEKFSLYIDAMSLDNTHEKGGIIIDQKQHQEIISAISEAKLKILCNMLLLPSQQVC
jgi:hypothetical protein